MKHSLAFFLFIFAFISVLSGCEEEQIDLYDPVAQAEADDKLIREYIAKDTSVHNPVRTNSGLFYVKRKAGNGLKVKTDDVILVHYVGKFLNGQVFESSYNTNSPLRVAGVGKGRVIKGWDEGLQLMEEGETARLYIPSGLAYGPTASRTIPANTCLVFDLFVVDVNP